MAKFTITAYMRNGDAWETIRRTREGLDSVISDILKDDEVVKFVSVETSDSFAIEEVQSNG